MWLVPPGLGGEGDRGTAGLQKGCAVLLCGTSSLLPPQQPGTTASTCSFSQRQPRGGLQRGCPAAAGTHLAQERGFGFASLPCGIQAWPWDVKSLSQGTAV